MRIFLLAMLLSLYGCKTPQSGESNDSILKAETDDRLTEKTKNLVDVSDKLNDHINAILAEARAATKPDSGWTPESIKALLEYVYSKTGADKSGTGILVGFAGIGREVSVHSYIGSWFKDNFDPERSEIIFLKFTESVYHNNQIGILTGKVMSHKSKAAADHSIAPVMNFSGVLLGSDKFGHFFQQGYWYYTAGLDTLRARCEYGQYMEGNSVLFEEKWRKYRAMAQVWLPDFRFGYFGSWATGVISYADSEANELGYQFWKALSENPDTYKFDIREHQASLPLMNESTNYNKYDHDIDVDFIRTAPRPKDACSKYDPVRP